MDDTNREENTDCELWKKIGQIITCKGLPVVQYNPHGVA